MDEPRRSLADLFDRPGATPTETPEPSGFAAGVAALFSRLETDGPEQNAQLEGAPVDGEAENRPQIAESSRRSFSRPLHRLTSLAVIAVALVLLAVAGTFIAIQLTPASPQEQTDRMLIADEKELAGAWRMLQVAWKHATEAKDAGLREADELDAALSLLRGYSDEIAWTVAVQAAADFRDGLGAAVLPELPAAFVRDEIDARSEEEEVAARRKIGDERAALDGLRRKVRAVESAITAQGAEFATARRTFLETLRQYADALALENSAADALLRAAMIDAASDVVVAAGTPTEDALLAYVAAVTALREDNARALEAAEQERRPPDEAQPAPELTAPPSEPPPPPDPTPAPVPDPTPDPTPSGEEPPP